jgi:hypothetical protein
MSRFAGGAGWALWLRDSARSSISASRTQDLFEEVGDARGGALALGHQCVGQLIEGGVAAGGEGDDSGDRVLGWGRAHSPPRFLVT